MERSRYLSRSNLAFKPALPLTRCFKICSVTAADCTARGGQLKCSNAQVVECKIHFLLCFFLIWQVKWREIVTSIPPPENLH